MGNEIIGTVFRFEFLTELNSFSLVLSASFHPYFIFLGLSDLVVSNIAWKIPIVEPFITDMYRKFKVTS